MSMFSTPFRNVTLDDGHPTQEPANRTCTIPLADAGRLRGRIHIF